MNRHNGGAITTAEHISQSVGDIVTTRLGTRLMRRDYGSQLIDLLDQPGNKTTALLCFAAIAISLMRWEPRIRVGRIQLTGATLAGQFELALDYTVIDTNEQQSLRIPLSMGATA